MHRAPWLLMPILAACSVQTPTSDSAAVAFAEGGCGEITTAGGSVGLGPLTVTVGPGVVAEDVELCIVEAGDAPSEYLPRTPLWQLEGGLPADAAVSVSYLVGEAGEDALYVSGAEGVWTPVEGDEGVFAATVVGLQGVFLGAGSFRQSFVHDGTDVDILYVIDNSCSMWEEQVAIGDSFPAMLDWFVESELDWRVGVVSTDMDRVDDSGKLRQSGAHRWVDPAVIDPRAHFANMVGMGTAGSGDERGLDAVHAALELKADGYNADFLRPESQIAVIVLSDEEDHSDLSVPDFVGWYTGLRDPGDVHFHSIVSPDPLCNGAAEPGARYLEATTTFGGTSWSVCDSPYDQALVDVCEDFWGSDWLQLDVEPDLETLAVTVTEPYAPGTILGAAEVVYDEATNRVRLDRGWHPVKGSTIEVTYLPR